MNFRQRCLMTLSCLLLLFHNSKSALAADPTIRWEIENRFRYFKNASDFRAIVRVYERLRSDTNPLPSALQLERALESEVLGGTFKTGIDRRSGWAAAIYKETCGRDDTHTHSGCEMKNGDRYLEPKRANILLSAYGITSGTCEWRIDNIQIASLPCGTPALVRDVQYDDQHHVELRTDAGGPVTLNITLRDVLIVSMGDSFAAGEGNPDKPVKLERDSFNRYRDSSPRRLFPVREDISDLVKPKEEEPVQDWEARKRRFFSGKAAGWLNAQCHRSLYSQHAKAALHYALEHPHLTVTFLNYSCTGAEVFEGLLNAWWARDDVVDSSYDDAPQFVKALRDLCRNSGPYERTTWAKSDRNEEILGNNPADFPKCGSFVRPHIDAMLLSVGGNDVGFARMIANASVNVPTDSPLAGARSWVYGIWRWASGPQTFDVGLDLAHGRIPKRYNALNTALKEYLHVKPTKVILSAYPQMQFNAEGNRCKADNAGMDVHGIMGMFNSDTPAASINFVKRFNDIVKAEADKQEWVVADQHLVEVRAPNNFQEDKSGIGHGICAVGPADTFVGKLKFPQPDVRKSPPIPWTQFSPDTWQAYSRRNRWFVTPNDAFLTTNYHDSGLLVDDRAQPLYAATLSGAFHPNALGHAAVADSIMLKLRETLSAFND